MTLEHDLKKRFRSSDRFDVFAWLTRGRNCISKPEQLSLLSFLAYTAVDTDTPVEELQKAVFDHFHVDRVEFIKTAEYEEAMRFIMAWRGEQGEDAELRVLSA